MRFILLFKHIIISGSLDMFNARVIAIRFAPWIEAGHLHSQSKLEAGKARQGKFQRNCPHEGLVGHIAPNSLASHKFQQLEFNARFAHGNQSDVLSKLSTQFNSIHRCSKASLIVDSTIRMASL